MNQHNLFYLTRWRLAFWYALVMGFILSFCGIAVYQAIARVYWVALERELESVAGTLHDSLEPKLQQPGQLEPEVQQLLPDICLAQTSCIKQQSSSNRHILGAIHQADYYMRLFDNSGRLVAIAGVAPEKLPLVLKKELWQTLPDSFGNRYHQISLSLHTQDNLSWGYMQMGRSLQELDAHLHTVKLTLLLGLPMAMILVGGSSWWLAGLAMQPIYQSYKQIQQFTADAAHELRTPLAATQAQVESALRMPHLDEPEARDILKTIERQNRRLIQLVADLLLLARLERQAVPMQRQRCCLNDVVSDLVEECSALALCAKVTLTSDVPHAPVYIVGDEEQLYRLVSNLIVNAIQYTPAGGEVGVILTANNLQAVIQVQDTGIGIAPEEQSRIFDRFYRVKSERSRHTGGAGLGLGIAQAIAIAHYGSLQVQSELGKGSTFTIRLPLAVTALASSTQKTI